MVDSQPFEPSPPSLVQAVKQAPVTALLIGLSVAVALVSGLGDNLKVLTWLTVADLHGRDGTLASGVHALVRGEVTIAIGMEAVLRGEVWRLVTPIFIHFGLLHIMFNMLWMKDLGPLIEARWSSRTLLALVLVSAVLSNLVQFLVNWDLKSGVHYANVLSGGMSGVVYALLGYVWIRGHSDPTAGIRLRPSIVWMMLGWLVLCMTGLLGPIGNSAHAVGLLVGAAWGGIAAKLSAGGARPVDRWA